MADLDHYPQQSIRYVYLRYDGALLVLKLLWDELSYGR